MKAVIQIWFFILAIFSAINCEAKVFSEVATKIRFIENEIESKNKININSGNGIGITCKSLSDLFNYKNWGVNIGAVAAKVGKNLPV